MRNEVFWQWFDAFAAPKLGLSKQFPRERTFRKMFEHLDALDRPVLIVETGCIEDPDNWVGNGCSTILFQKYLETAPEGSRVMSFEIDPEKCHQASMLCPTVVVVHGDSVENLFRYARIKDAMTIDLLYLDASHHDWANEAPSQVHHYNELMAAMPALRETSMVAIDDTIQGIEDFASGKVMGKGGLVAQYALEVGADLQFCDYQVGFTNITRPKPEGDQDIAGLIDRARQHIESGNALAADRLYRLVMIATPPPWSGRARVARGEAAANFARNAAKIRKYGVAVDWFRTALECDPRATDYRVEMVRALVGLGAMFPARQEARIATVMDPENPVAWGTLGGVEADLQNAKACATAYDKQINTSLPLAMDQPGIMALSDAYLNRATIALDTEDYDRVRVLCREIIKFGVREGDGHHMLAMLAYRESRHEDAIELFDKAIAAPCRNLPLAQWNKHLPLHSIGRYREGWEQHQWGEKETTVQALYIPHHRFNKPKWDGKIPMEPTDKPIIVHVHTEAGHGDNIAVLRFLPVMVERGYHVRYECDPALIELAGYSMPEIEVVPRAVDYPGALGIKDFDFHIPIGDLPHAFGTEIDTVLWRGPYLHADPMRELHYRRELASLPGRKIGLCWSSGIRRNLSIWMERYGTLKSMKFSDVKPIVQMGGDSYISLQVGEDRADGAAFVHDVLPDAPDWTDTAALIENLDLVITVDTAVAHLAGAMGKPVWIMTQRDGASWHFMCYRPGASWNESSPWYPSARVFRQHDFGVRDWSGVVEDVIKALSG